MTPTIYFPAVPIDLPPETMQVSQDVLFTLQQGDIDALFELVLEPGRTAEILHENETHYVELYRLPSGQEVWAIVRKGTATAFIVLPIEPTEVDA